MAYHDALRDKEISDAADAKQQKALAKSHFEDAPATVD